MPRHDGTTPSKNRGHHKGMHSASKGRGGDAKLKEKKRIVAAASKGYRPKGGKKEH
jgi:hypothetical protein